MDLIQRTRSEPGEERIYEEIAQIGTGAYGVVYKARDLLENGKFVALKKVQLQGGEEGMPVSTVREIAMLRKLSSKEHKNVVRLLDVCYSATSRSEANLTLVFEYIDQDLTMYLQKSPKGLNDGIIKSLMYQLISGVDFLHSNRIVHRDIKPQNVLLTEGGELKLTDFGLAKVYGFTMALTTVVVTLWYRSPEVLLQASYATPVDLWSCGCIFAELFNGQPLFPGISEVDQLCKVFELIGLPSAEAWAENVSIPVSAFKPTLPVRLKTILPNITPLAEDLLNQLLLFNPHKRISAGNALCHPYFMEYMSNES